MMMGTREADALRPLTEAELEALRPADDLDMPDDCGTQAAPMKHSVSPATHYTVF